MSTRRLVAVASEPIPTSLSEDAYRFIKERILDLRMPPGSEFTEGGVVAEMGLSKTPVREALARLRQEGLVDAVARSGYRVTPVTIKDARDLMALRGVLEGEAAALAAMHGSDANRLRELEKLCQAHYDPSDRSSVSKFLAANFDFHMAIAGLSGNGKLEDVLRGVLEQLERIMHLGLRLTSRADEIVHEHKELVAAILTGDADGAREIAVAQARTSQRMIVESLLDSDAVMSLNLAP